MSVIYIEKWVAERGRVHLTKATLRKITEKKILSLRFYALSLACIAIPYCAVHFLSKMPMNMPEFLICMVFSIGAFLKSLRHHYQLEEGRYEVLASEIENCSRYPHAKQSN